MNRSEDRTRVREALDALRRALAIFDEIGDHAAAAQVDHLIHLVQSTSEGDFGK